MALLLNFISNLHQLTYYCIMRRKEEKNVSRRILKSISGIKRLAYIVNIILFIAFFFVSLSGNMFTFHFMHANVFHLLANMLAVYAVVRSAERLLVGYVVSSLVYLLSSVPVVGFSAILFFIWGSHYIEQYHITSNKRNLVLNLVIVMAVSAVIPNISFVMHFFPFVLGVGYTFAKDRIIEYKTDIKDVEEFGNK